MGFRRFGGLVVVVCGGAIGHRQQSGDGSGQHKGVLGCCFTDLGAQV